MSISNFTKGLGEDYTDTFYYVHRITGALELKRPHRDVIGNYKIYHRYKSNTYEDWVDSNMGLKVPKESLPKSIQLHLLLES